MRFLSSLILDMLTINFLEVLEPTVHASGARLLCGPKHGSSRFAVGASITISLEVKQADREQPKGSAGKKVKIGRTDVTSATGW